MEAMATYRDFRSLPTVVFPSGHLWVVNQLKELAVSEGNDGQYSNEQNCKMNGDEHRRMHYEGEA